MDRTKAIKRVRELEIEYYNNISEDTLQYLHYISEAERLRQDLGLSEKEIWPKGFTYYINDDC